ncbi:MAG TPA: ABC transporter ATP-binding protein [Pyrinomonadaceae bacterium]|nr:ABC transporter ATP-binding protein [Pyrinomonadaceae bacterium]
MTHAIEVEELRKFYRSKNREPIKALDGVSFQVPEGRIYGLLGPNGAGKSTLVKILSTITPPSSGDATVMGCNVVSQSLAARKHLSVVLQQTATETLLTVRDNLLVYAYLHGVKSELAQQRLRSVADEFELGGLLRETVQELSLGTKRRLQVAKIFMLDAPVIILDEATTGMDPLMKRRVMDRLRAEAREGRTILLTTQVLSEAEELCESIMILNNGKSMASGTLPELRKLSTRMFRVSLTFAETNGELVSRLEALKPVELEINGKAVEMVFQGEESSLLGKLADISRDTPILQFEVRGPTLEEIFIALMKENR